MKKLLCLFFVIFVTMTASAQLWQQYTSEADELKGTQASSYHAIKIPGKCGVFLTDSNDQLSIITYDGIFDFERFGSSLSVVDGLFGMYDEKGGLVSKEKLMLIVTESSPEFAATANGLHHERANSNGIKRVAEWIRNNKGYVRIVIPRYGKTDLDEKVPTMLLDKELYNNKVKSKSASQNRSAKRPVKRK